MTEGITFNDSGTIHITFDDETYRLPSAHFGEWLRYSKALEHARRDANDRVKDVLRQVSEAEERHKDNPTKDSQAEIDRLEAESRNLAADPFYNRTSDIVAEMFAEIGDKPLPAREAWPAWLAANTKLAGEILAHWQQVPKASGAKPPM